MTVNRQQRGTAALLNMLVLLPVSSRALVPIENEAGSVSEWLSTFWRRETSLLAVRNQVLVHPTCSLVTVPTELSYFFLFYAVLITACVITTVCSYIYGCKCLVWFLSCKMTALVSIYSIYYIYYIYYIFLNIYFTIIPLKN
jgi:cellulose synthase/poly-beta-1,6-N-acetylglucosamine synthase-like glycosyltransferase